MAEGILDRALQSAGDFRHREFGDIGGRPLAGIGIGEKGRVHAAHGLFFGPAWHPVKPASAFAAFGRARERTPGTVLARRWAALE